MARLIDGDALIAWIKGSQQMTSKMKSIICYIKTMPTIDAVEVVRCKDCRHNPKYTRDYMYGLCVCCCEDDQYSWTPEDDDFCSYGERRE